MYDVRCSSVLITGASGIDWQDVRVGFYLAHQYNHLVKASRRNCVWRSSTGTHELGVLLKPRRFESEKDTYGGYVVCGKRKIQGRRLAICLVHS